MKIAPDDVFLRRDWELYEARTRRHVVERRRSQGPAEAFRVAADLRAHVAAIRPDWPDASSREADFSHHVRLSDLLRVSARSA